MRPVRMEVTQLIVSSILSAARIQNPRPQALRVIVLPHCSLVARINSSDDRQAQVNRPRLKTPQPSRQALPHKRLTFTVRMNLALLVQ